MSIQFYSKFKKTSRTKLLYDKRQGEKIIQNCIIRDEKYRSVIKFSFIQKKKLRELPRNSGVYCFKNNNKILYIGKAVNLRERVKNHFLKPAYLKNLFINQVKIIGYIKTDSEIEALILEANLIKKYQPKYNVLWRDDKNYFFVGITKEEFPRVFWTHQTKTKKSPNQYLGPFVEGKAVKKTLRVLRKVFPYYSVKKHPKNLCPWCHLDLCPGPNPNLKEYQKNIKNLIKVLRGEKKSVLRHLKERMAKVSQKQDFEKAAKLRDQIISLEKVLSHAKILQQVTAKRIGPKYHLKVQNVFKKLLKTKRRIVRIEAYDVSNIQGQKATGSMITFTRGLPDKNLYRKFKIKIAGKPNDTAMLKETLTRRFRHLEWGLPDLILIDGGKAQLNVAIGAKNQAPNIKHIKVVALAKKKNELFIEGRRKPILLKKLPREIFNLILQLRDEAHRFAISYHLKLRDIDLKKGL